MDEENENNEPSLCPVDGVVGDSDDCVEHENPPFYDWTSVFPGLQILKDNYEVLKNEMLKATNWQPWPETNLYSVQSGQEWKVFPFCYTFPSWDETKTEWVKSNSSECPKTVEILKSIPGIRTALYSRMSPGTRLASHQGWAMLANSVLRVHFGLLIPEPLTSGVCCDGEVQHHQEGELMIFDDSLFHSGFNQGKDFRCVLIIDIIRPTWALPGIATGGATSELESFIKYFQSGGDKDKIKTK